MKKQLPAITILFIGTVVTTALVVPRLHWGYWFGLPSANWTLSSIASVERFTTFDVDSVQSGQLALKSGVDAKNSFQRGDNPVHNLPVAIVKEGLSPTSSKPVLSPTLVAIHKSLESRDVLIEGASGYPDAKILRGHVVIGQGKQGDSVIVAALWGGQAVNDGYPYYEALFVNLPNGELQLLEARQYWFDIAGVEGGVIEWISIFLGLFLGSVLCILYFGIQRYRKAV